MPLINLHNCYLSKVTVIQAVWLYKELNTGRHSGEAEGEKGPSMLSHVAGFFFPKVCGCQETVNTTEEMNSFWRESHRRCEGAEYHAMTKLRINSRNPDLFRWLLSKLHIAIYFHILSYPAFIPCKKGRQV